MPTRPKVFRPTHAKPPAQAALDYDRYRNRVNPARKLYSTARWHRLRAQQLADEPLCRLCQARNRATAATVCDHVTPHRGDVVAFWRGPFQSLCDPCHVSVKQREERGGEGQKS